VSDDTKDEVIRQLVIRIQYLEFEHESLRSRYNVVAERLRELQESHPALAGIDYEMHDAEIRAEMDRMADIYVTRKKDEVQP